MFTVTCAIKLFFCFSAARHEIGQAAGTSLAVFILGAELFDAPLKNKKSI